jgi:hypothetical protein
MDDREQQRKTRHRLAILRHAEGVTGNVSARGSHPNGAIGSRTTSLPRERWRRALQAGLPQSVRFLTRRTARSSRSTKSSRGYI